MAQLNRFLTFLLLSVLSFQLVIASRNLRPGTFKIESLLDGTRIGVNLIFPDLQPVYLDASVKTWVVRAEGDNEFRLGVGGYIYTGNIDNGVFATIHREQSVIWTVKYAELQDAYTIELADTGNGWTVSPDSERARVEITPIVATRSFPPQYPHLGQLWRFVPLDE